MTESNIKHLEVNVSCFGWGEIKELVWFRIWECFSLALWHLKAHFECENGLLPVLHSPPPLLSPRSSASSNNSQHIRLKGKNKYLYKITFISENLNQCSCFISLYLRIPVVFFLMTKALSSLFRRIQGNFQYKWTHIKKHFTWSKHFVNLGG